ncbi:MAG: ABC transporter permease [Candidatus Schekmanbacteria bacterium RIFCSPHIGHO2_02_FULL_38_11]|uniref:ABC transporter permease n=1 Tax=Candidatus Schekmanbacteria bacterium RIFCSPLOWO2_12_FULL_38_15 TaxID=1817883 RepID=A0A1F7SJR2_9BACT|nr:MAG: ABC transporter permease [Candidatus Schekmanbacteria bacterium GWA2_38_9]OGL51703.1 MAG: ABC transporter permease [Candidatus Schekmanbacteria bacterium RIFCSPLOWO2_02_FULL_38_14]OGL52372.1 MAG: ABC transporter permease [Candidatus Schekmanbacteria bacterium RIFCSPHIGHO2_02_FULL_38_11]OGL54026.1 MAG: ABC transporter permease [Candidatus Schekmanbacteria bacterium RIFCSPLOWO2_12_FULL_38_15]
MKVSAKDKGFKRFSVLILIILSLQILSSLGIISKMSFPSPLSVCAGIGELILTGMPPGYRLLTHIEESLVRVFLGFILALMTGFLLGIIMGWSKRVSFYFNPVLELLRPVPPLAWLPLSVLWFGIGIMSKSFLIFLGAFFPILVNTILGVNSIEKSLIDGCYSLGASRRDIIFKVVIPGSMPSVLTGIRIGMGIGWMTLVAAELTGVKSGYGLGYMIMTARDLQRIDLVVAGMVTIGIVGYLLDAGVRLVEERVLKWRM